MNGLPKDFDGTFLIGAELVQVCIGHNDAILGFEPCMSIATTSPFRVGLAEGEGKRFEDPRSGATALIGLLHQTITGVEGQVDGTLTINFGRLELYDDFPAYESYEIMKAGHSVYLV